jgi:O-antigen ligase
MSKLFLSNKLQIDKKFFIFGISLTTIAITPWWTSDGFNTPKLFFLVFTALAVIPTLFQNQILFKNLLQNRTLVLILLFPLNLIIVFILNNANKVQQFYGELGRKTGFLTYFCCYLIFFFVLVRNNQKFSHAVLKTFLYLGTISATYGLLQPYGIFKINGLSSKNMAPFSFFGNVDFNSGFLGLVSIVLLAKFIYDSNTNLLKSITFTLLIYVYVAIYLTKAQQGFLISFSGAIALFMVYIYYHFRSKFKFTILLSLFLLVQFILSLFNRGYFNGLVYEQSVQARNYYWRAGWEMTMANPILGLGLDRYSDWYWAYRDQNTINVLGPGDFTTSAHNIFLDISSSGGFPLLVTYLLISILVFIKGISVFSKMTSPNYAFSALFASWIGFNVYSLVGIGQIGVFVWGWIFAGLILGWDLNFLNDDIFSGTRLKKYVFINFISIVVTTFLLFPLIKETYSIRQAKIMNSSEYYLNYLKNNKIEPFNISFAINKLNEFGLEAESVKYVRQSLLIYPNSYPLWTLQYTHKYTTQQEKLLAYENLLKLNFYNRYLSEKKAE